MMFSTRLHPAKTVAETAKVPPKRLENSGIAELVIGG